MECAFHTLFPSFNAWLKVWFAKIQRKVKYWSLIYEYQNNELQLRFALWLTANLIFPDSKFLLI